MSDELKKSMKVYDKDGFQLGIVDKIINIKSEKKENELKFLVKKRLFLRNSPRIAFTADKIKKIDKRKVYLDVELVDFESKFSQAQDKRKEILDKEKEKVKKSDGDYKPKYKRSDVISFDWDEIESRA